MLDDELERLLAAELERKMRDLGITAVSQQALSAMSAERLDALLQAMDFAEFIHDTGRIAELIADAAKKGGLPKLADIMAAAQASGRPVIEGVFKIAFDVVDRNVVAYAEQRAATLVVEIADDMRTTIRQTIVDAVGGGKTTQEAARSLARVIPLHSRYARAVQRREQQTYTRLIREGLDPHRARIRSAQMATRYAGKLTRLRARTIARTEVMTASNYGQWQGYNAAMNAGLMANPASGYRAITKEWITAEDERVCPVCGPLDKVQVDWSEPFPNGRPIPPAHPNCRCSYNVIDNMDQYDFDGVGTAEQEYPELVQR